MDDSHVCSKMAANITTGYEYLAMSGVKGTFSYRHPPHPSRTLPPVSPTQSSLTSPSSQTNFMSK